MSQQSLEYVHSAPIACKKYKQNDTIDPAEHSENHPVYYILSETDFTDNDAQFHEFIRSDKRMDPYFNEFWQRYSSTWCTFAPISATTFARDYLPTEIYYFDEKTKLMKPYKSLPLRKQQLIAQEYLLIKDRYERIQFIAKAMKHKSDCTCDKCKRKIPFKVPEPVLLQKPLVPRLTATNKITGQVIDLTDDEDLSPLTHQELLDALMCDEHPLDNAQTSQEEIMSPPVFKTTLNKKKF